jgi:hypothetical protein
VIARRGPESRSPLVALMAAALASAPALGCRVDEAAFEARVFHCDTAAPDPLCGTDANGAPMTCFAARQLGGTDFCTERCDAPMSLPAEDAVCVQGNALLTACNPADDLPGTGGACGRPELGCLRTDVLTDEGVCVTMQPCSSDVDCHDPVRSTCAATFLKKLYAGNPTLHADHLYCLQDGCQANDTACSPGETCLRNVIPPVQNPPDICVPNCDSQQRCPPNQFCYQKLSGPDSPAVCLPGLLGFECETDVDCLVGKCTDMSGGPIWPKLCSIDCNSDADCAPFDSNQGLFFCNSDNHCVTPYAFRGTSCKSDDDCTRNKAMGAICTRFAPADAEGTCLLPCDADGTCPAFSGIPQTCLASQQQTPSTPVCFPGLFGYPCATDDNCVGGLSCRGADSTTGTPGFCTTLCQTTTDCDADRWLGGGAFCSSPICVPKLADGKKGCTANEQCASKICTIPTAGPPGTCGAPPS